MADLSWHMNRVREGTRGGRAEFKWSDVKNMSHAERECYLGGSTKMGIMGKLGKFQKSDWYNSEKEKTTKIDEERGAVQKFEEELMQEALGLRPKKHMLAKKEMTPEQMKAYFKEQKHAAKEERIKEEKNSGEQQGLGFAPHRTAELEEKKLNVLGKEAELEGRNWDEKTGTPGAASSNAFPVRIKDEPKTIAEENKSSSSDEDKEGEEDESSQEDRYDLKTAAKKAKKARKKAKRDKRRAKKKEKKLKKKEKKEKKRNKSRGRNSERIH